MTEKKVILILGKRGSGKSYLARHLLSIHKRYFIYDTLGEYTEGIIFDSLETLGKFWGDRLEQNFRIIYQPLQPEAEFESVCDLVYACENIVFLVEEIDTFSTPQSLLPSFANVVQRGRHKDITLIGVSQRPYGMNRVLSSQAKEIYSFIMTEPRDLDYLNQYFGKEIEDTIRGLKQYQYVKWTTSGIYVGKAGEGEVRISTKEKPEPVSIQPIKKSKDPPDE